MPVDKEEIVTPAKIKEWKHLRSKANEVGRKDNVQVGFLIGANCMKALDPTKIIHSEGVVVHMPIKLSWIGVLLDQ